MVPYQDGPFAWLGWLGTTEERKLEIELERRRNELKRLGWGCGCGTFLLVILLSCGGMSLYGLVRLVAG
jgi:hypothetical protein